MPDWTASMQQTFEYYTVDPVSWKDVQKLDNVTKSTIVRDLEVETLGNATIDVTETIGESYIRIYLVTFQNGIKEKFPLGTFLVQTPSSSFSGKIREVTMDAYTPLLELKENRPPLGYSILKNQNIMENVYMLTRENLRAPVVETIDPTKLTFDFVAETDDTWLSFNSDLAANVKYSFSLDELGRVLFSPKQDTASLHPVWTYNDDNSSILYGDLSMDHDMYGIPNVVEVVYSNGAGHYYSRVVNNDLNSPTSIVNRGREIVHREVDPKFSGYATQKQIDEYANQLLRNLSTMEYKITYTHGYCPVRLNDCVRLNYSRAGINNVKAKVIRQSISCRPGCPVTETAIYTAKLWG